MPIGGVETPPLLNSFILHYSALPIISKTGASSVFCVLMI
jgi:hypothetical protein